MNIKSKPPSFLGKPKIPTKSIDHRKVLVWMLYQKHYNLLLLIIFKRIISLCLFALLLYKNLGKKYSTHTRRIENRISGYEVPKVHMLHHGRINLLAY